MVDYRNLYISQKEKFYMEKSLSDTLGECVPVKVKVKRVSSPWNLYFFATDINSALEKTKAMNFDPINGEIVNLDEVPKTYMYDRGIRWAQTHKKIGKSGSEHAYYIGKEDD